MVVRGASLRCHFNRDLKDQQELAGDVGRAQRVHSREREQHVQIPRDKIAPSGASQPPCCKETQAAL